MIQSEMLFRSTDPISSERAAEELTRSGRHDAQNALCLSFLRTYPGLTSKEIAMAVAENWYSWKEKRETFLELYDILHKRLPDLRRAGKAKNGEMRKCRVSNRLAQTWLAV